MVNFTANGADLKIYNNALLAVSYQKHSISAMLVMVISSGRKIRVKINNKPLKLRQDLQPGLSARAQVTKYRLESLIDQFDIKSCQIIVPVYLNICINEISNTTGKDTFVNKPLQQLQVCSLSSHGVY